MWLDHLVLFFSPKLRESHVSTLTACLSLHTRAHRRIELEASNTSWSEIVSLHVYVSMHDGSAVMPTVRSLAVSVLLDVVIVFSRAFFAREASADF